MPPLLSFYIIEYNPSIKISFWKYLFISMFI